MIWIAALLLGSGLFLLTAPAWASDGVFAGIPIDTGVDTDADNRFEILQVNVTVDVTVGGDFTVEGSVYDSTGFTFITSNSTVFSGGVGSHLVSLNFEGRDIFGSRIDGPYRVELDLRNDTFVLVDIDVHFTSPYRYVSFGPIFAFTPPHTDVGLDTDGDSLFNFIQVNVSANTSLPGHYFVFGGIFSSGIIDFKIQLLNLTAGDHIIPFNFSGVGAFISGNDGPYEVLLSASVIECGRDPEGEGDSDNHTTAAYFFTDFESAIKRDLTGSVTNGTTGQPVANETVWLANQTHRWLTTFETNATGNFSFVAFEGSFILMAGADGLQDEALPLTIEGDTSLNVTLEKEEVDVSAVSVTLSDWGNATVHVDGYGYADNQSQRFLVDQFVGNGDLVIDDTESDRWIEVFRSCFAPFNNTAGQFEVDGTAFDLDNGTWVINADLTGPVTSTAPTLTTQDMNFTAQSPILALATHEVFFWASYDDENETEIATLTFPSAWVLDSFWPVSNVTVGPLNYNTITIDPLGRPSGDPPSVGVVMNATLDTTPPLLSNVMASPDPQEVFGSVTISAMVTDNSGIASVWANITDPSGGAVCNCSMTNQAGSDDYTYAASFGVLGVYNFTVWAEDDAGLFASRSGNFTIQDTMPPQVTAASAAPDPQELGQDITIIADVADSSGIASISVRIEDPLGALVGNFTMAAVDADTYDYTLGLSELGVHNFTVWVKDGAGLVGSLGGNFTIQDSTAPSIGLPIANPDPQELGQSVAFSVQVTDNDAVDAVTIAIEDPNANPVSNVSMTLVGGTYIHADSFDAPGTYSYTIWATDPSGNLASRSGTFVVEDPEPPSAVISGPNEVDVDVSFTLDAGGSSDNHLVANYTWDFGDGTMAYGSTVTHAYEEAGDYTVTLTVLDASGNEDTATLPITVLAAAPDGGFSLSDTTLYAVLAALAVAGITAGVLYWRRGARAAGPKGPPPRPEGEAQKKPSAKASKKPPEEPPEPELDELDREIEDLLKP